jgi:hypothetical protein
MLEGLTSRFSGLPNRAKLRDEFGYYKRSTRLSVLDI